MITRPPAANAMGSAAVVGGLGVFTVTAVMARRRVVDPAEREVFRSINDLPRGLLPPVYVVMQAGSLGAVGVAAAAAGLWGRPRLASSLGVTGTAVWGGCKVIKNWVGRGRPAEHIAHTTIRGAVAHGLGFPSGHSAVAFALATIAARDVPPSVRPVLWAGAAIVATARVYVGAHFPLDVIGGAALGIAVGSAVRLLSRGTDPNQLVTPAPSPSPAGTRLR